MVIAPMMQGRMIAREQIETETCLAMIEYRSKAGFTIVTCFDGIR